MDAQVELCVRKCRGCMLVAAPAAPEPMKRKELPAEPWQHIAIDYMGPLPSGHNLLVVVDYYSRYIEIEIMTKIDSTETIKRLSVIFARFGLPLSITADNAKQLISDKFRNYCEVHNIQLTSTIPYWPQQNREAERQIRLILKRLVISQNMGTNWINDLNEYLLMYRSTPHSTTLKTPAEMLFGHNIRDKLPNISHPMEIDEATADIDKEKKEKGKQYADERRHAKVIGIKKGDKVLAKEMIKANKLSPTFNPAIYKVIEREGGEVIIESIDSGVQYRRNVSHLQKIISNSSSAPDKLLAPTGPFTSDLIKPNQRPKRITKKPNRYAN